MGATADSSILPASVSTLVWKIDLLPHEALQRRPMDVSPDGQTLLYTERNGAGGALEVLMLWNPGSARPTPLFASPFNEAAAASRRTAARWLAPHRDESGRMEAYVAPYPPTGVESHIGRPLRRHRLQAGARWNPNGGELFFVSADGRLMAVSVARHRISRWAGHRRYCNYPVDCGRISLSLRTASGPLSLCAVPETLAGEQPLTIVLQLDGQRPGVRGAARAMKTRTPRTTST